MKKLGLLIFLFSFGAWAQSASLSPDEKLVEINKSQTLYKYIDGDKTKPLMVFLPGDGHLARISYGFPGGKDDDFLAYWLNKKKYPFLGVSYPNDNPVFQHASPDFKIRDWGNQIAQLTKKVIEENHLSGHVVILAWGTAGCVEEVVQESMSKLRISLDQFVGFSATSPLIDEAHQTAFVGNHLLNNAFSDRKPVHDFYLKQLLSQNEYNGHEIIPAKTYATEFLGNTPIALLGEGYFLDDGKVKFDLSQALDDTGVFRFSHTPWIGLISDDSTSLERIALIDPSNWNYLRSEMIYHQILFYANISKNANKFAISKRILSQIPQHFSDTVHGNHLFFVGKKGARETAQKIETLLQKMDSTKQNLVRLALEN